MRQDLFIYRASFLHPIFSTLQTKGININAIIHKTQLKHFNIEKDDSYIPSFVMYEFLQEVKKTINIDVLFSNSCHGRGLHYHGEFGNYLRTRQTLKETLADYIILYKTLQNNQESSIDVQDGNTIFNFKLADDFCSGRHIAELSILMKLVNLSRNFIDKFEYKDIKIKVPYYSLDHCIKMFCGIKIYGHQNLEYQFIFPNDLLDKKNKNNFGLQDGKILERFEMNTVEIVSKIIESYKPGYLPSLQSLSNHFNLSRSTMRRVLLAQKTCFSKLLENILLSKASGLLSASDMNVITISEHLGYSESANFIRSFKKWTGITPGEYRESIMVV